MHRIILEDHPGPVDAENPGFRTWLEDGDTVTLLGWCEKPGAARIGFGECVGTVFAAPQPRPGCGAHAAA